MWVGVEGVKIAGGQEFDKQIVGDYREKNMLGKGYSQRLSDSQVTDNMCRKSCQSKHPLL